jgi:segregation and condensation protein A
MGTLILSGIILAMEHPAVSHPAGSYQVATTIYEGPLDLLLQLIERAQLDITRLALAQITDQYLEHLKHIQNRSADEVSAFLAIASRLILIKSEALLPRPPQREPDEEDPGEALARQLRLYKIFKTAALYLEGRESAHQHSHLRLAPPLRAEAQLDLSNITLEDLVEAARAILVAFDNRPELKTVVTAPTVTIRQKIGDIIRFIKARGKASFLTFIHGAKSRIEIVVTFLAMLELIKRRRVQASQAQLFGEIELQPAEEWEESGDFELEFGE